LPGVTHHPLDPLGRAPGRAGLFLDFDGVLADIAPTPEGAVARAGIPELLEALQARLGRVAIVSGRPVNYLDAMIPMSVDIVGLYGLEWRSAGVNHTLPEAEPWRSVMGELIDEAVAEFGVPVVEPKGLSLTLHYRGDPTLAGPIAEWARKAADVTGVEVRSAKLSFELHPPIHRDKGTALVELADGLDPVAYMGDDLGDLPAFDGLDQLARHGVTTVRIAVSSEEAPPMLLNRADQVVDGPAGAQALLDGLLEHVASAPR